MLRTVVLFSVCLFTSADLFGPKYEPTKGAIWPKPKYQVIEDVYYKFNPERFNNITVTGQSCDILQNALERYSLVIRSADKMAKDLAKEVTRRRRSVEDGNYKGYLEELQVELTASCETQPYFGMNESYNLTVSGVSRLSSASVWGVLRGLESFVQLFFISDDEPEIRIKKTYISDEPRYEHRGLLIDTSRHFISLSKIQNTLDAMTMNKMNVLHWHIVDDQSFPYQSEKFPELSAKGAYHRSLVYTKEDIQMIVSYATDRGIRVLPEFDVPGHTRSWGESHPEILTTCYSGQRVTGLGPMNPINNATYSLLQELITELQELFPEKYFHVGGDEVDLKCWESNPELVEYMRAHGISSAKLHSLFMERFIPMLAPRSNPIVWADVFDEGVPLPEDALVHVWWNDNFAPILRAGHNVIYSTAWYLDQLKSGGDWEDFYLADPMHKLQRQYPPSGSTAARVVGGEACMWAELVDDHNVISRVWPRASAVAERLWSPTSPPGAAYSPHAVPPEVHSRLEEHYCRMNRRGVAAQPPNGPGVCLGAAI